MADRCIKPFRGVILPLPSSARYYGITQLLYHFQARPYLSNISPHRKIVDEEFKEIIGFDSVL